jgi:hypothetical protein
MQKSNHPPSDDSYSPDEIAQRRDAALLKALSTSHKKQTEMKIGKSKPKKKPSATRDRSGS